MKKGLALFAAASGIAIIAAPAAAQEASPFTGPRVEAVVGYDIMRPGSTTDIDNADDLDQSIEDVTYGVGVGYDFNLGGAVVGLEGEYTRTEASTRFDTTSFSGIGVSNVDGGRDMYLGARVGAPVSDNLLLYAKGGYTNASLNVLTSDNITDSETNADLDGWRVGAGAEYALNESIFLKTEYRYSKYEEGEFNAPSGQIGDRIGVDLDRHQFMVGVGGRF